ncbi:ROK family protein [Nocardioides sp. 503]|uniref:ROK family protein n=1 Tax=Nocardioides sp. 503 TaxID=2508326 RepID=UPI001FD6E4E3|nr:ROK family protein [Nocardioides sp. 503]
MTSFGLDIGATKTLGIVLDADGAVLAQVREPTLLGAAGVLETTARVVHRLRQVGEPHGPIGVGVPGLVDVRTGSVTHAVNLGLDGEVLPLESLLAERLGHPVVLENDVNAATLGAASLTGADDLAYLSIGTGLAAGLLLDGRLRRGTRGAAGEIGHLPVDPAGARCQCGQRGCLETVASGAALSAAWPSPDRPAAQSLFAAAAAGDPAAVTARRTFVGGVAQAVIMLGLTVDVDTVVLGGGVSHLGESLRAAVAEELHERGSTSPFLASLGLADRVRVLPDDLPVAAVGAALLGDDRRLALG